MGVLGVPNLHPRARIWPCTMPRWGQCSHGLQVPLWTILDGLSGCCSPLLLCAAFPGGLGLAQRAGVCAGNYSAFPLSPFHLLDKTLTAGKSQRLQTSPLSHQPRF